MGYHVTILRSESGSVQPIDFDEILAATDALGNWEHDMEKKVLETTAGNESCTLWYNDGELWTSNPSEGAIEQMVILAKQLNARVRGDEFETYETKGKTFFHPDDKFLKKQAEAESAVLLAKEMKLQRLIAFGVISFFVILGLIGFFIGKQFEK